MSTNDYEEFAGLVRRYKDGDSGAFAAIYEKTSTGVYATCLGVLSNPEDAEDAMQETYISVFNNIDSLEQDKTLIPWINRIAVNKSLDIARKRKGDIYYEDAVASEEIPEGEEDFEGLPEYFVVEQSKRDTFNSIIRSELSDVQYQTVFLHYYDDMSVEEISSVMGCPEGTVKTRLKSSRVLIRKAVERYETDNKDSLEPAGASASLGRFFAAYAGALAVPPAASIMGAVGAGAGTAVSSVAAASGARTAGEASAAGKSAAAAKAASSAGAAAAKAGFLSTAAGKAVVVAVAAAVVIPAGVGVAYLINNSRQEEEPEEEETEVSVSETEEAIVETVMTTTERPEPTEPAETEPALTDIALEDLPDFDKLQPFIGYWSCHDYDHAAVPDDFVLTDMFTSEAGVLVDFSAYYPDYDAYATYDDPQGLFTMMPCYRVSEEQLTWVEANILNISSDDITRINSNINVTSDGEYYYGGYVADGYVWYSRGWAGYSMVEMIISAKTDGQYYYITSVEYDELVVENNPSYEPLKEGQRYDYVMEYKEIDGAYYWTILSCGPSSSTYDASDMLAILPEQFSYADTGWKEAYASVVSNTKPQDFDNGYNEGSYSEILCDLVLINDDDIPELIVSVKVKNNVCYGHLYTFVGGEAVLLKSLYGYESCYNSYEPRGNCIITGGGPEQNGAFFFTFVGHMTDDMMSLDNLSLARSNFDLIAYEYVYDDPNAYTTVRYYYYDSNNQAVEISEADYQALIPGENAQPLEGTMSADYFLEALGV